MTVIIFGGTGYIGRHICQRLSLQGISGYSVSREPDRGFLAQYAPTIQPLYATDDRLREKVEQATLIIYLASSVAPMNNWDSISDLPHSGPNLFAKFTSMVSNLDQTAQVVIASSGGQIYGKGHLRPIAETTPSAPVTSYALEKQLIESMACFMQRVHAAKIAILRIANPVGRWQFIGGHGFISAAVRSAIDGSRLSIFGAGTNVRDYFDADELAELFVSFLARNHGKTGIYNVGSGKGSSELDVINLVERTIERSIDYEFLPARQFDLPYAVLDCSKAVEELGWTCNLDLEEIVRKQCSIYKEIQQI